MLNKFLVQKQGLTKDETNELEYLHILKNDLFLLMEQTDDNYKLRLYAALLESLEYNMQRVWHFPQDSQYHNWWHKVPNCNCPSMDNDDPLMPGRIIREDCPIHGSDSSKRKVLV